MNDPRETFAVRLKLLRETGKYSHKTLGAKLNLSRQSISGYETLDRFPSIETLVRIAFEFNVSVDWLLGIENRIPTEYVTATKLSDKDAKITLRSLEKLRQLILSSTLD